MNSVLVILTFVTLVSGYRNTRENVITIRSDDKKNGTIFSKGYPYSYTSTELEIFDFRGNENEKVQIIFEEFHLYPNDTNKRCGETGSSFISYKKTSRSIKYETFCGDIKPLPIMSESENFILRYEPIAVPPEHELRIQNAHIGFSATFKFVKNFGIEYKLPPNYPSTNEVPSYGCDFNYDSEYFPSGTFNSPNFPGMFPDYIECFYSFTGPESFVVFQFEQFNLLGSADCNVDLEKKDKLQILLSIDGVGPDDLKYEYCGKQNEPITVKIPNGTAYVLFHHRTDFSDYELAVAHPFVGFNATFMFTNNTTSSACDHRLSVVLFPCVCLYLILNQRLHF